MRSPRKREISVLFHSLVFYLLGTPSTCTIQIIEELSKFIAERTSSFDGIVNSWIYQDLNYVIWSTSAATEIGWASQHVEGVDSTELIFFHFRCYKYEWVGSRAPTSELSRAW